MSELSAKARNKLAASKFAGPDRSYPVNDKAHAANAKARAAQMANAGKISAEEKQKIDSKADAVLHRGAAQAATAHTAKHHGSKGE